MEEPKATPGGDISQATKGIKGDNSFQDYVPMTKSLKEIRAAIPARLFKRSTTKGLMYLGRDLVMMGLFFCLATFIDPFFSSSSTRSLLSLSGAKAARWAAWGVYWWFQGLVMTGLWVIGHEAGHLALSPSVPICHIIGLILHSFLLTPYFSWRYSHHTHHTYIASMEKDNFGIPDTRSDLSLPSEKHQSVSYSEFFEDTPMFNLLYLVGRQIIGFPAYLLWNASGQKVPRWTNHFNPNSVLFTSKQRNAVILSDIGVLTMAGIIAYAVSKVGAATVFKYYGLPWVLVGHWITMAVFLHHTDPRAPRFRGNAWNFQRGAAATVDREFLGWQGRFFLHDISHYHVIHHYFSRMPFYNGEEATVYLKEILGPYYIHSSESVFKSLWDTYRQCKFIEDDGDIVFYKDNKGKAARQFAQG
ncbi:hypothetical protein M422DRAFT_232190 [Sphaerobolus stellatus SS14]|uniref:Fatty acid desaturase domain-containing protein n=1 Tax=Sphaerobolus stellatus (strain SS14) TaxID=990650 RepID=A0A0C9V606_SPHS4|nr:hypothetical protein M422DRAFT_232190 [Sphaerobolus stellatus SS14]